MAPAVTFVNLLDQVSIYVAPTVPRPIQVGFLGGTLVAYSLIQTVDRCASSASDPYAQCLLTAFKTSVVVGSLVVGGALGFVSMIHP